MLLKRILHKDTTATAIAGHQHRTVPTIQKYARHAVTAFLRTSASSVVPSGKLILVVDGLWTYFHKKGRYTLYLMTVRNVNDTIAYFLDPALLPGRESIDGWRMAMAEIPDDIRQRICAMVSDGLRGLRIIAVENGWIPQRCHFHLLAWFQRKHGQYFQRGKNKWMRDAVLAYVQVMLETQDQKKLRDFQKELEIIIRHPDCPRYLAGRIREFLRTIDDFRAYLRYPQFNLPTTSNTVETMIRLLRDLIGRIRGTRTPEAFLKWTTAYIRSRKTIMCNGKNSTKFHH